jgi:hypothetical protein
MAAINARCGSRPFFECFTESPPPACFSATEVEDRFVGRRTLHTLLEVLLAMSCTRSGVVMKSMARCAWRENTRMKPSGQQNVPGRTAAMFPPAQLSE